MSWRSALDAGLEKKGFLPFLIFSEFGQSARHAQLGQRVRRRFVPALVEKHASSHADLHFGTSTKNSSK